MPESTPHVDRDTLHDALGAEAREHHELAAAKRLIKVNEARIDELEKQVSLLSGLDGVTVKDVPDWSQPPRTKKEHRAIANLLLSDLHLDEVVDLGEMRGKNKYDRPIALQRYRRVVDNTIKVARDYVSGVRYDGLWLWVDGDIFSGEIHDELRRTNADFHILSSLDHWVDPLAAGIVELADYFKRVHLVFSYGNHTRSYEKPHYKGAVRSSYDWFLARTLWRELRSDKRLSWNIPESMDVRETVYSTRFLMHHGTDFKGSDQVAGAVRPVMMGDFRTMLVEVLDGEPYDCMLVGHFHQHHNLPRAIMNGSVVGYNEHAKAKRYRPELPQQAFWLVTPENGRTGHFPIWASDPKEEGWRE